MKAILTKGNLWSGQKRSLTPKQFFSRLMVQLVKDRVLKVAKIRLRAVLLSPSLCRYECGWHVGQTQCVTRQLFSTLQE